MSIDDNIVSTLSFGCRYIRLKIANDKGEPPAKHAAPAFQELMASAAKRDCLPSTRQAVTKKDDLFNNVLGHFQVCLFISTYTVTITIVVGC